MMYHMMYHAHVMNTLAVGALIGLAVYLSQFIGQGKPRK